MNRFGNFVRTCWDNLPQHFPNVDLDEFVVMPNHVHRIIVIAGERVGAKHSPNCANASLLQGTTPQREPPRGTQSGSLGAIIQNFKSISTRRINRMRGTPGAPIWQRNYFEHIIRNEKELNQVREYITANPARWTDDENNPSRVQMEQRRQ